MNNELDELEKIKLYLSVVPELLKGSLSELEEHISELQTSEDALNETTYESLQQVTGDIVNAARYTAKSLKMIAENLSLPEKGEIAGPGSRHYLEITEIEKHEIVEMTLSSVMDILRSHFELVPDLARDITDTCQEHLKTN